MQFIQTYYKIIKKYWGLIILIFFKCTLELYRNLKYLKLDSKKSILPNPTKFGMHTLTIGLYFRYINSFLFHSQLQYGVENDFGKIIYIYIYIYI